MPSESPPRPPRPGVALGQTAYRLAYHAFRIATSRAHRQHLRQRARARHFYAQFVRRGDLCFDVGANHGDRTESFLRLRARVVAVEPNPECAADLRHKFDGDRRFTLVEAALGAREGSGVLFVGEIDAVSSLSREWIDAARRVPDLARAQWSRSVPTTVTTLDRLIERYGVPDFCKIDVEGYEPEVLAGLSRAVPALSFEYTPWRIEPALACIERLERLANYRFALSREESFRFVSDPWCDGVALRRLLREEAAARQAMFGDVYARA